MMSTDQTIGTTRIAGAPISWGVCEVPGWGHQLPSDRVLREMHDVGLAATELGPDGFLPPDPDAMAAVLQAHHLQAVGGFTPVVLHQLDRDPATDVEEVLDRFAATGSTVLVLSADSGLTGYDSRPELDGDGWKRLLGSLDRISALAADRGVRAVLHPHVGTMVETPDDVGRVLDGSSVALCLDTGHLLIGGTDPSELARQAPERIAHVHAKDVDATKAQQVRSGRLTYTEAITRHLTDAGYDGWYVLEQDTILTDEPAGEGPVIDVRASADHMRSVLTRHR